jgi:dephospho-CoA kinase
MIIIGLTGTIGAGKSTIIRWLAERGACAVDADQLTREVQQPGEDAYSAIVDAFGTEILQANGEIDRSALGAIVFANAEKLRQLEAIVHPAVYARFAQRVASCKAPVLVVEAIKLLESGRLLPFCDEIWVVIVSEETQLERLLRERGMPEAEARRRIANQMPEAERVGRATRVIANNGTRAELHAQLAAIWSDVTKKYGIADVQSLE